MTADRRPSVPPTDPTVRPAAATPSRVRSFDELVDRAARLAARVGTRPGVLGICGPPGAGKTTVALAVVAAVRERLGRAVRHVPMDGYHLADVELERLGRRGRKGAADTFDAAGYAALLARIRAGGPDTVYAPAFDREIEQPVAGSIAVEPGTALVVTEGLYLLRGGAWAAVRPLVDEAWYVELPGTARTARLVGRHEQFGKTHEAAVEWVTRVDGANAADVEATRAAADVVVPGDLQLPAA